jgi:hypothetical protein
MADFISSSCCLLNTIVSTGSKFALVISEEGGKGILLISEMLVEFSSIRISSSLLLVFFNLAIG